MNRPVFQVLLTIALAAGAASAHADEALPREIEALNRLCRDSLDSGDDVRAAAVCKRIHDQVTRLAPGSDAALASMLNLAELKRRQDNNLAADELYTAALLIVDRAGRGATAEAADLLERQADARVARGKIFEAEPGLRRAVDIREAVDGATALRTAATRVHHATVLGMLLQFQDAHVAYRRSLAVYERAGPAQRDRYLETRRLIAELLGRQFRLEQAEGEYRRLLEDADSAPRVPAQVAFALDRLGWIAEETGRPDEALALYQRALHELGDGPAAAEPARLVRARIAALAATGGGAR